MVNRFWYKCDIDKLQNRFRAQVNILPLNEYYRLQNLPKLHSIRIKLSAYNCSYFPLKGSCIARIKHNLSTIPVSFLVTDTSSTHIIGLNTSPKLNLTKRVMQVNSTLPYYLKELRNYFSDIGCLSGKNHTVIDTNQSPTVNPPKPNTICPMWKVKSRIGQDSQFKLLMNQQTGWII